MQVQPVAYPCPRRAPGPFERPARRPRRHSRTRFLRVRKDSCGVKLRRRITCALPPSSAWRRDSRMLPGRRASAKRIIRTARIRACKDMCGAKPSPATPSALRRCNAQPQNSKTASRRNKFDRHLRRMTVPAMSRAPAYQTAYSATKAFLVHFGCGLSQELRGTGVSVTTFAPAGIAR